MSDIALLENNFIERTYPTIVSDMSIAFAELVANSWDAGATRVDISIPDNNNEKIIIEDNGSGMNDMEFRSRWMVIAYNRVQHQGEFVEFTTQDNCKIKRLAYGRNGVGRHALMCFDDHYTIETWKDGYSNSYDISTIGSDSAFSITNHTANIPKDGKGTRIIVNAKRRLPDPNAVISILGYKYLFDPQFEVYVNGNKVEYHNSLHPYQTETLSTEYGDLQIEIYRIPDGEKSTSNNGIAIWVNERLVGSPSWVIGDSKVEDARRKFATKHIVIVKADFLIDDVNYDWTGFRKTQKVINSYRCIANYLREYRIEYYKGKTKEVRDEAVRSNKNAIRSLSISAVYNLKQFFDAYLEQKPEVDLDELNIIVSSLVNVLGKESGLSLLSKLSLMSNSSITELDKILEEWSVSDIKNVLEEIDYRIKVIDAIQKLGSDSNTDELHVLHPLISQAKWLFGIEYDNPNYTFNRTLSTVIRKLLGGAVKEDMNINFDKRPDLIFTSDSTVSATCTEDFDQNEIAHIDQVLIIELKKGGFKIGRKEMNQAKEYIDGIYKGNEFNAIRKIKAFVIGDSIDTSISTRKTLENYGELFAYTYNQLVQTAEKRLFNLKSKLEEHYNKYSKDDYLNAILNEPDQLRLEN